MIRITTTQKGDKIVARSGNKQRTVAMSPVRSTYQNHGDAAAAVGNVVIPSGQLDKARRTATAEQVSPDKFRFTFDV